MLARWVKTQNRGVQKERFQYIYEITMLFYSGYKSVGVWGVAVIFSWVFVGYIYEITMLFYSGYKSVGVWGAVVIFSWVFVSYIYEITMLFYSGYKKKWKKKILLHTLFFSGNLASFTRLTLNWQELKLICLFVVDSSTCFFMPVGEWSISTSLLWSFLSNCSIHSSIWSDRRLWRKGIWTKLKTRSILHIQIYNNSATP